MPIDASIPLQVAQQPNMLAQYANALQVAGGINQQKAQQQQLERQNKLSTLLAQDYDAPEAREAALLQGGFIDESTKLGKDRREGQKLKAEIGEKEFKTAYDKSKAFLDLASSAKDQQSYTLALQTAQSMGLDVSQAPPQYDPAFVQSFGQQAMTSLQRVEQEARKRGLDIQALSQQESARHNRVSEGLTARGQNLTDARARDLNAITKDNKPLTEGQAKSAAYGSRMKSADEVINSLEKSGKVFSTPGARTGFGIGAAVNVLNSAEGQQLDQAKRDFINATLRRESGAVISDSEFENAEKQYFPQIGDKPEVIKQKARNRQVAQRGVLADVPEGRRAGLVEEITGGPNASASNIDALLDKYK